MDQQLQRTLSTQFQLKEEKFRFRSCYFCQIQLSHCYFWQLHAGESPPSPVVIDASISLWRPVHLLGRTQVAGCEPQKNSQMLVRDGHGWSFGHGDVRE